MKHIITNKYFCLFLLVLSFSSCKKEIKTNLDEKDENIVVQKKDVVNGVEDSTKDSTPFLYEAITNVRSGVFIYEKPSTESEVILALPYQTKIKITAFSDVFEYLELELETEPESESEIGKYGKWVEVNYKRASQEFTGYVFDDFLNYQFKKDDNLLLKQKDTVIVFNEREFVEALSSNRVIWIDTETINIETYQKNLEYINDYLVVAYDEELPFSKETHYYLKSGYEEGVNPFGLYGYENLEIRGKNELVNFIVNDSWVGVITFTNCANLLIDNINFHHESFDGNTCDGAVTIFEDCNNIRFQNVHLDGSGTIGSVINSSEKFTFLNCEFYRNSISAMNITESREINLIRADIHNNDHIYDVFNIYDSKNITVTDSFIKNNIINNDVFEILKSSSTEIILENSSIDHNTLHDNFAKLEKSNGIDFFIDNCTITNNISKGNDCMFYVGDTESASIKINRSVIRKNTGFYNLINEAKFLTKENNVIDESFFDQASDSVLTKFNSYDKEYISREFKNLNYDSVTKQFNFRKHLLKGKHKIYFKSNKYVFSNLPLEADVSYVCKGNLVNGKLEGSWEIVSNNNPNHKYKLNLTNGVLNGEALFYIGAEILKKKGSYLDGKRNGVWEFYTEKGVLQKKVTYNKAELLGVADYYFRNGVLREHRTDVFNKNGVTICYYPNGKIESEITYLDGRIDIKKSTFYTEEGKKKKAIERELIYLKNKEGEYVSNIDETSSKYKNKVQILYTKDKKDFLGYQYYLNGKANGVLRISMSSETIKTDSQLTWKKGKQTRVEYFDNGEIRSDETAFRYDLDNNLIFSSYKIDKNRSEDSTYDGEQNTLIRYAEYKDIYVLHGVLKTYNRYGRLIKEERYEDGKKL